VDPVDDGVRKHVLAAIERIVNAEAEASGALRNPEITTLDPVGCSAEARVSLILGHHPDLLFAKASEFSENTALP